MRLLSPPLSVILVSAAVQAQSSGCAPALGVSPRATPLAVPSGLDITKPRALAFHPLAPEEMWVVDASSASVAVLDKDDPSKAPRRLKDRAKYHYMASASSISFDAIGQFATCQDALNTYEGTMLPNFFMGPTLYDSRISLVNQRQDTCEDGDTCFLLHVDMLHEAPL